MHRFNGHMFKNEVNEIFNELLSYTSNITDLIRDTIKNELIWSKDYLKIKQNKLDHQTQAVPDLTRGDIVLVKFGENIGAEFKGLHYAIVLRNCKSTIDTVLLLPITSQKPKLYDPNVESIYVEIPAIPGFNGFKDPGDPNHPDTDKHWANILNIRNTSRKRIVFPKKVYKLQNTRTFNKISNTIVKQIALR